MYKIPVRNSRAYDGGEKVEASLYQVNRNELPEVSIRQLCELTSESRLKQTSNTGNEGEVES